MATYYKVTNVSARSEKGERSIFLNEAGKLLLPGESAYNLRRINDATRRAADARGLEILEQSSPFKDPAVEEAKPVPAPKVRHREIVPDLEKMKAAQAKEKAAKAKAEAAAKAAAEKAAANETVSDAPAAQLKSVPAEPEDKPAPAAKAPAKAKPKAESKSKGKAKSTRKKKESSDS